MAAPILTDGAVRLLAIVREDGLLRSQLAEELGAEPPSVTEWLGGKKIPDAHMRLRIQRYTRGEIPIIAWEPPERRAEIMAVRPRRRRRRAA